MVQSTLPTPQEGRRPASTSGACLATATMHRGGPRNGDCTPGRAPTPGARDCGRNCGAFRSLCHSPRCPGPPRGGPQWLPAGARGADRAWGGAPPGPPRAGALGLRALLSRSASAPLHTPGAKPRGAVAWAVLARGLAGGWPQGVTGPRRARGARPLPRAPQPAATRLARRPGAGASP